MSEPEQTPIRQRTALGYVALAARGFAMGAADIVPGVSGGTMALITGIYEELIHAVRSLIHVDTVRHLIRAKFAAALAAIPWRFLVCLGIGVATAIVTLSHFLKVMLKEHPIYVWAFFFGLVFASIWTLSRHVKREPKYIGLFVVGAIIAYVFVGLVPVQTPEALWFLFGSGMVAACAMLLPGISGSFVLVLLGKYQPVLEAVSAVARLKSEALMENVLTIVVLGTGVVTGAVCFVHVLGWVLKHYRDATLALLIGLMLGSLRKIWPWKETVETMINRHGEVVPKIQHNILPNEAVVGAICFAIVGFALVLFLDRVATNVEQSQAESTS